MNDATCICSAAQSYNTSISPGFSYESHCGNTSCLAGTHWVLSNGAVVTWEGELVAGPSAQSTPLSIDKNQ